mgnify:CR=1 FL=1
MQFYKWKWVAACLAGLAVNGLCLAADAPKDLSVGEGLGEPLGYHDATPMFSWKLPAGVKRQTARQIELTGDGVKWDSGWVESDQSVFVPYGGEPLRSRQQIGRAHV